MRHGTASNRISHQQYTHRSHAGVLRFFDGLEMVEPGLVQVRDWRTGIQDSRTTPGWRARPQAVTSGTAAGHPGVTLSTRATAHPGRPAHPGGGSPGRPAAPSREAAARWAARIRGASPREGPYQVR